MAKRNIRNDPGYFLPGEPDDDEVRMPVWIIFKLRELFMSNFLQKNEPSPTSMRQMVLEIFHFKVRNLSNMDVPIL